MVSEDSFKWVPFYMELADKLTPFRTDRKRLLQRLQDIYDRIGVKFPKLENDEPMDVDPFTVFGMFNKGISNDTRIKIAEGFRDEFGIGAEIPSVFEGVPVLNNLSANFYGYGEDRKADDIDTLWEVLVSALAFADDESVAHREVLSDAYDRATNQLKVKWNLTMALYWIRPYVFVNLDSRNRWFITDKAALGRECAEAVHALKGKMPDARHYLKIRDLCKEAFERGAAEYRNFPELSLGAWNVSERKKGGDPPMVGSERDGLPVIGDEGVESVHYWVYSPGVEASNWKDFYECGVMGLGWNKIGDISEYDSKEAIAQALRKYYGGDSSYKNAALALWQFVHDMKPGDIVFAKRGKSQIIGRGIVMSEFRYDTERKDGYKNIRGVRWTDQGERKYPGQAPMKTLTDLTRYTELVDKLKVLFFDEEVDEGEAIVEYPAYGKEDFLEEVYVDEREYGRLTSLLRNKKNIILQGAPGVGKTFMAKRLAYSMMGLKDQERVELVQFHQSYSYEDFIMGYRPSDDGFELRKGTFYNFCKRAEDDSDNDYFFIIDEINRGNLSKIFGELFMLIEPDKRGVSLKLLYSDERFSVPANVYLIGMMNTADRSLAMLDYALRRRFAFYELNPGFRTKGFCKYRMAFDSPALDHLVQCVEQLNDAIEVDDSLGRGFRIGHSYFCGLEDADQERLEEIVEYEIIPMLQEYWFDDAGKVSDWSVMLRNALSRV